MQSIQTSPKIEWGLWVGSKYERSELIYEINSFQNGKYSNLRAIFDEEDKFLKMYSSQS
jgi:hypothetical protein